MKRLPIRERDTLKAILRFLSLYPRELLAWRNNTGALSPAPGRFVRFGVPGSADITGILRGGRRLEIEVKAPRGRLSADQEAFGENIRRMGGLYVVAYSVEDVQEALRKAGVWSRR
jgi:hypothetical protein